MFFLVCAVFERAILLDGENWFFFYLTLAFIRAISLFCRFVLFCNFQLYLTEATLESLLKLMTVCDSMLFLSRVNKCILAKSGVQLLVLHLV